METWPDRVAERILMRVIDVTEARPLAVRRRLLGAVVRFVVAPLHVWLVLVCHNLAFVRPDLPRGIRHRLAGKAGRSAGVSLAELLAIPEFRGAFGDTPVAGPGVEGGAAACQKPMEEAARELLDRCFWPGARWVLGAISPARRPAPGPVRVTGR